MIVLNSSPQRHKNKKLNKRIQVCNKCNFKLMLQAQQMLYNQSNYYLDLTMNSRKKLISKNIPVNYRSEPGQENILELGTMSLILDGCKEIIAEDYISYLEQARKQRRQSLHEKKYKEYLGIVLQMAEEQFRITQDGFRQIAQSLEIKEEDFENSFVFYSQHEELGQEFVEQLTFIQQNMKDILQTKFALRKQQGIDLIKFQISVIENYNNYESFDNVLKLFKEQEEADEALPIVLNTLLDDIIFDKFGYEEEDKIRFLKKHHMDKEVRNLQATTEHLVKSLFIFLNQLDIFQFPSIQFNFHNFVISKLLSNNLFIQLILQMSIVW